MNDTEQDATILWLKGQVGKRVFVSVDDGGANDSATGVIDYVDGDTGEFEVLSDEHGDVMPFSPFEPNFRLEVLTDR